MERWSSYSNRVLKYMVSTKTITLYTWGQLSLTCTNILFTYFAKSFEQLKNKSPSLLTILCIWGSYFNSLSPGRSSTDFKSIIFTLIMENSSTHREINVTQVNATEHCWSEVNIGLGNGLASSGNTSLPELMLTQNSVPYGMTRPQWVLQVLASYVWDKNSFSSTYLTQIFTHSI